MRVRLALVTLALIGSSSAESRADDDVVVRGQGMGGGFVSRAKEGETPREVTDAASLVEGLPGVHVRRLGADDSFATLSVRGTGSNQVAVYLAGVPLTGGADPTLDLATLPLWPGAAARVYRSFAPATLGRGSLGGTLALDPPTPRTTAGTEVWTAVGSFGARRLRVADVRALPGGARLAVGLTASRSDDDFLYLDRNATRARREDVFVRRQNAGHAAASGIVALALPVRFGPGRVGALTSTTLAQVREQDLPGTATEPTPFAGLDSTRLVQALELTIPEGPGTLGVRAWGRREGLSVRDAPLGRLRLAGPSATDDAIVAAGGSVGWKTRTEATTAELRVDGSAERFAPGTWVGGAPPPSARRSNVGLAVDGLTRPASWLAVGASGRADAWNDASETGDDETVARPSGNLTAEATLGPVIVASHGGYLVRPASFVERFGNRGTFLGDPRLRPEAAATIDLGARFARKLGPVRVSAEAAGFATNASDLIVFVSQGAYGQLRATNIGRARILGLEADLRALAFGFEARASHTALATANQSECTFVAGACERPPLPQRPSSDLVVDLAYARGPLRVRYGIDVVSGMTADLTGAIQVPARVLHSTGLRLTVPRVPGLSISLEIRNLFDLRVASYAGVLGEARAPIGDLYDFPLPGRRFLLSARLSAR